MAKKTPPPEPQLRVSRRLLNTFDYSTAVYALAHSDDYAGAKDRIKKKYTSYIRARNRLVRHIRDLEELSGFEEV